MTTSSLGALDPGDPRLKLRVENRIQNIFVTQSEDNRNQKEEHVNHIPVVTETSGRVLEAGVNTLQKTLVLKKQAELDVVDQQLAVKRAVFKSRVEGLAQRRSELELKSTQTQERAIKFEKFAAENEAKRRRAQKKYEAARELNISKQREIEAHTEQFKQLKARHEVLKEREWQNNKIFEDYLMKNMEQTAYLFQLTLDNGSESLVMPIIRRHETLSITHRDLLTLKRWGHLEEEVEQGQRQLQIMKQEHSIKKLMANKELSELQSELETLKEKNEQAEVNLLMEQGLSREKVKEVGCLLMAINNLADLCYIATYGPLENMNILTKMDMVKEYIQDKADTERRARRLMESGSAITSRTALTDKREKGSIKSMGSKTQIKNSSKVSRKSETMS
ncbi:LOW QUALITY PROTEIN: coiled-coil domain-containing protein 42 homolog [Gymnodraco acuticeps]|uniref:LOW QUALITY PROTEIN: coiled-coil domain-containing protein 42 homolog n=1 Tax=Gymnodraco acuticeps TaxID=8218 RepID=A0A6P8UZE4_GYMAC|nr:LOW QUALITY PROTEIN: coiled-coil domain-containing protein 42 homolog [Gymnodraco acuticeps]